MNMDECPFMEWIMSNIPSDDERKLVNIVADNMAHFEDMLFAPETSTYKLIQCQSRLKNSDEWINDEVGRPDELAYFSHTFLRYKVEKLDGMLGYYNHEEQLICVTPEALNNNFVILHEMIHVYEDLINELPLFYHDMVYWALYSDLRKKIPKLDEIITGHAHLLNESSIYQFGGLHDILFLLKSFDLDIRMGAQLGTVFGYNRVDVFKEYGYK